MIRYYLIISFKSQENQVVRKIYLKERWWITSVLVQWNGKIILLLLTVITIINNTTSVIQMMKLC